jgi:hypothetical protein
MQCNKTHVSGKKVYVHSNTTKYAETELWFRQRKRKPTKQMLLLFYFNISRHCSQLDQSRYKYSKKTAVSDQTV